MTTPATPPERVRESVLKLEALTGRRAFVFVRPFDHLLSDQIQAEIVRVLGDDPQPTALDVVLESDGGQADAAYKAVLLLREITTDMRVLVPRWAKSAATLFALGADGIAMRRAYAELGPLDAQVIDPRNPAQMMSALDGYQSVEYLRDYALQTQDLVVSQIMTATRARIPLAEILALAEDFAVDVITPIISSVKPLDFGGWGRTLDIGKAYAERLLALYGMAGHPVHAVRKTADHLVYGYPHHGYVIDVNEAKELGLNVEAMDTPLYRAALEVADAAFGCGVQICDDMGHQPTSGYCGFAPGEPKKTKKTETKKEVQANGASATRDGKPRKRRAAPKRG